MSSLPKNLVINLDALADEKELTCQFAKEIGYFYSPEDLRRSKIEDLGEMVRGALSFDLHVALSGKDLYITGSIRAKILKTCDCCLEPFEREVHNEFNLVAIPKSEDSRKDIVDLTTDDLNILTYTTRSIDLKPIFREQIELLFPIKYICREDCKGLCPQCGANLNQTTCNCRSAESSIANRPFQNLKK